MGWFKRTNFNHLRPNSQPYMRLIRKNSLSNDTSFRNKNARHAKYKIGVLATRLIFEADMINMWMCGLYWYQASISDRDLYNIRFWQNWTLRTITPLLRHNQELCVSSHFLVKMNWNRDTHKHLKTDGTVKKGNGDLLSKTPSVRSFVLRHSWRVGSKIWTEATHWSWWSDQLTALI